MDRSLTGLACAGALLAACAEDAGPPAMVADTIYVGDHIITVDPAYADVDAVAVAEGRVLAVGVSGRTVVLFTDGDEVARIPVELRPGEVAVVRR